MTLLEIGQHRLNQCNECPVHTRIKVRDKWEQGEPFTIIITELPPLTREEKERMCEDCCTFLDKEGIDIYFEGIKNELDREG